MNSHDSSNQLGEKCCIHCASKALTQIAVRLTSAVQKFTRSELSVSVRIPMMCYFGVSILGGSDAVQIKCFEFWLQLKSFEKELCDFF